MLLWSEWGDILSSLSLGISRQIVSWQETEEVCHDNHDKCLLTLSHCHNNPGVNIITHSVSWTLSINNMIIFCSSTGTRVLNRIWQIRKHPALLYSFQCCSAYLPFLPCIWCKPIRFKMCLLKDYLCWFPPSFLSQPVYKCSVHCIVYFAVD